MQNVLWITNVPLPEASHLMGISAVPYGGWLIKAAEGLVASGNVNLTVAFPDGRRTSIGEFAGERITHLAFPAITERALDSDVALDVMNRLIRAAQPEIVHIFGTEYAHALAGVRASNDAGVDSVVSIQGLISVCADHYTTGIPPRVQQQRTLRDAVRQDSILQQQAKFRQRGSLEIAALKASRHIVGRTEWDRVCVSQINNQARYYSCNETLRESFYRNSWDITRCERRTLFTSQGTYPIKGLHLLLRAMPLILQQFPDTKLYVAGCSPLDGPLRGRLGGSSYQVYLRRLIRDLGLEGSITYTGVLDERAMCKRYLSSHAFVLPSTIENSPNSLGEAMLLGVPCVASNVGGVSDLVTHGVEGLLYQVDAPYMLAHRVCEVFADDSRALRLSRASKKRASETHDIITNTRELLEIYRKVHPTPAGQSEK